jgi:hypothetical protein
MRLLELYTITKEPQHGLWFLHQSPLKLDIIKPQSYQSLKNSRPSDYPLKSRYHEEDVYRHLVHSSSKISFTYATIVGYHKMYESPTNYPGYIYFFKLSKTQISKTIFSIADGSGRTFMKPTVGIDGLNKAIHTYSKNINNFKSSYEKGIGTINPRIEVIISFPVTPIYVIPQEEDR